MNKIHIDEATNEQIDYAVAVAQGWILRAFSDLEDTEKSLGMNTMFIWTKGKEVLYSLSIYQPTTNQTQCGELIDRFLIDTHNCNYGNKFGWAAKTSDKEQFFDQSRLVAACKAFLWSKYPDGMIPTEETKDE